MVHPTVAYPAHTVVHHYDNEGEAANKEDENYYYAHTGLRHHTVGAPHGDFGYYDNAENKEGDNVAYLHQKFVTHTGTYGWNAAEDANKQKEAENYYLIHHRYPTWYTGHVVVHHYDNEGKEGNKTEEAENYYRIHGVYPTWYTRHTVVHHYDNEAMADDNKTKEAENYYRIHHVWPAWYTRRTVVHHYDNEGKVDDNKTEEAENYYRVHGYYPTWYTGHTFVHHFDNEAENYYRTGHHYFGHRGYPYVSRYYDNEGKEAEDNYLVRHGHVVGGMHRGYPYVSRFDNAEEGNKAEDEDNYLQDVGPYGRRHHAYPYQYGYYDNQAEDGNKAEEAENYYRTYGYYPRWYTHRAAYGYGWNGS